MNDDARNAGPVTRLEHLEALMEFEADALSRFAEVDRRASRTDLRLLLVALVAVAAALSQLIEVLAS